MTGTPAIAMIIRHRWLPGAAFAALWVALAMLTTNVTFHLAPAIVAGAAALISNRRARARAAVGFVLAAITTMALSISGHLEGPSLLPVGGAAFESIVMAAVGAVFGAAAAGRLGHGSDGHAATPAT